jgi:hypothetical protein
MSFPAAGIASNEAGIEFMRTELSLAHTFMDVAETTKLSQNRLQSREDTQKAYRALLHFLPRLQLSAEQKLDFDQQTEKLKERMIQAGIEP